MYTTCRVGVLLSEISKHSKISPPPSLRSHLTSSPMGEFSGDYGNIIYKYYSYMYSVQCMYIGVHFVGGILHVVLPLLVANSIRKFVHGSSITYIREYRMIPWFVYLCAVAAAN